MFRVESLGGYNIDRGRVFLIESPVVADRNLAAMLTALDGTIVIDGIKYVPKGFEWQLPATPVLIGEKIGILV